MVTIEDYCLKYITYDYLDVELLLIFNGRECYELNLQGLIKDYTSKNVFLILKKLLLKCIIFLKCITFEQEHSVKLEYTGYMSETLLRTTSHFLILNVVSH
jgi:hypothetical protein